MTKIQVEEVINQILPLIPKNKRGFSSHFDYRDILKCIFYKLKTGCQWRFSFADIEGVKYPFSWQTVYYYYNKWSKQNTFELAFEQLQSDKGAKLDLTNLNLDGTQSFAKKGVKR
jgi:hypothetical protein